MFSIYLHSHRAHISVIWLSIGIHTLIKKNKYTNIMYALMKLSTGVYLSRSIEGRCYRFNNICLIVLEHLRRVQNLRKRAKKWKSVISDFTSLWAGGWRWEWWYGGKRLGGGGSLMESLMKQLIIYYVKKQYTLFEMFSTSISWQYSKLLQKE